MSKPDAPPAPDYTAAAQAQGASNLQAAIAQGILNRPNEVNPLGSRTWEQTGEYSMGEGNPAVPMYTAKTELTPTGQKLYDTNVQTQQALGDLGLQGAQKAGNILGQQFDVNTIPGIEASKFDRNSVRDALLARTNEDYTRDLDAKESQLIAQGIPKGSKAWDYEMQRLDRGRTDARRQAELSVGQMQQQELDARRQMIQEALLNRQTPLNEISALRSGSQVQQPNFQPYAANANVQAAPMFNAALSQGQYGMDQYGIDTGSYNNMLSGLFSIGAAAAMPGKR